MTAIKCNRIKEILERTTMECGWDDYAYTFTLNKEWLGSEVFFVYVASKTMSEFLSKYKQQGLQFNRYKHSALNRDMPFTFTFDQLKDSKNALERQLFSLLEDFSWHSGFGCPTHGYGGALGMTTFFSHKKRISTACKEATIASLAPSLMQFNAWAREILKNDNAIESLSAREIECMFHVAEGKTSKEIARILSITKRTVDFHVQNGTRKLGSTSRIQAASRFSQLSYQNQDI